MFLLGLLLLPAVFAACPTGTIYNDSFKKCYAYIPLYSSPIDAEGYCIKEFGGHLVTIQSAAENNYVASLLNGINIWIGLNELTNNQWTWATGQSSYRNFAQVQTEKFVANFTSLWPVDRMWRKENHQARRQFVCQVDPNEVDTCAGTSCEAGYIQYKGNCKCYLWDATRRFHNDSVAFCASKSAHLTKIETFSQNAFLLANSEVALGVNSVYNPWIDISCPQLNQCFWSTDHSPLSGYKYFFTGWDYGNGLFNSPAVGSIGAMETNMGDNDGQWIMYEVKNEYRFAVICEKDAVKTGRAKFQQKV